MNSLELQYTPHGQKVGALCPEIRPNVTRDTLFMEGGQPIGFYVTGLNGKLKDFIDVANAEFRSDNVPKQEMSRGAQGTKADKAKRLKEGAPLVTQYSTTLGSMQPKPHMKRPYPSMSAVHQQTTAHTFIKAMLLTCRESELMLKKYMPAAYKNQIELIERKVPVKWRFGNLFTSSISNYNVSAAFHRDTGNLRGALNVIITKRFDSYGGCLHVPCYDLTVECADNSMLVYPAYKTMHGVTPIHSNSPNGYRNTLIFYALKGFEAYA